MNNTEIDPIKVLSDHGLTEVFDEELTLLGQSELVKAMDDYAQRMVNKKLDEAIKACQLLQEPEDFEGLTIYNEPDYNHGIDNAISELKKLMK